jgi:hypothetical protein
MTTITLYDSQKSKPLHSSPRRKKEVTLEKMRRAMQLFGRWFTKEHLWGFFHGSFTRDNGYIERNLKNMEESGELVTVELKKGQKAYTVKRVNRQRSHSYDENLTHELYLTGAIVRFWRADPDPKEMIPPSFFKGCPLLPDFALRLSSGTTIVFEMCTDSNFTKELKHKVRLYPHVIERVEKPMVVFACDVDVERIGGFVERNREMLIIYHQGQVASPYYFTDYRLFRDVPLGQALTAPIYLWYDGSNLPTLGPLR